MRIGLDFDNTIAGYDSVFTGVAQEQGLISSNFKGSKKAVRDAIRLLPDGERRWMALQGQIYGKYMHRAAMIGNVDVFLKRCRREDAEVLIISHKTEFGHYDPDRTNLRDAAKDWMTAQGFFDQDRFGLDPANVFFAATRAEKVARIVQSNLTHFVDDLTEVFEEPGFPGDVGAVLFAAGYQDPPVGPFTACATWSEIEAHVFDRHA